MAAGWHACAGLSSCTVGCRGQAGNPQNTGDEGAPQGPIAGPEGPTQAAPLWAPGGKGARLLWGHAQPGHRPESRPALAHGTEAALWLPKLHAELVVLHHFQALAWHCSH